MGTAIAEEQVPTVDSDAFRRYADSTFYNPVGSLFVGNFDATNYRYVTGVRFATVPIPQGVTIVSASLIFTPRFSDSGTTCRTLIQGDDQDDAGTYFNEAEFVARFAARTTASVIWEPGAWIAGVEETSPDIAPVVQEITDRGSWVTNNGMGFFFHDNGGNSDTAAFRRPHGRQTSVPGAAKFNCTYQAVTGQIILMRIT